MKENQIKIRPVALKDNEGLASIIRTVLEDFDANKPGFAAADPETDRMYESYQKAGTQYWVAELNGQLVGGAGIGKLKGYSDACELQKMYLLPSARGKNLGVSLMEKCLTFAKEHYKVIYIETLKGMDIAQKLYKKNGFIEIPEPLGKTGHFGCDVFLAKYL